MVGLQAHMNPHQRVHTAFHPGVGDSRAVVIYLEG